MGGMMSSMTKTSYYGDQASLPKLQKEYMVVTQRYLSTKYREVLKNRNNLQIAMEKKYFDKIQTMRTNVLAQRKVKRIGWKEFLINYLDKQSRVIEWYSDIVEDMKNAVFLNENKYLSHIFFKEFERNTKPKCLQNILNSDYGDSNNNDYNEQIVEFNDLEENIINRLSTIHPDMTNAGTKESLCLSKIDLTGVTENLGGSFFSSKSQSFSSNDPGKNYKSVRNRIKYLVKIFKEHLSNKDHPITIAMEIFERHMSYVIGYEIGELKKQKEKNEANYEQNISDISAEIVEHIQKFIIKTQNALKLYYGTAVNLECFLEEKDELINLITSCFFQTGKIYNKVYELFSMQINRKIVDLDARLKQMSSLTPKDIDIPDKFSLDEATIRYQNELKEKSKGVVRKKKPDQIINNDLTGRITVSSGRVELNQKFHDHNKKHGYSTVIKIIHGLKHNKVPFEKMLLIASISTEITECVNSFWEGYEDIIPSSSLLNINADELMAIFIYIVVKAQFPEIILHQKIVNDFTSRTTKSTMIGYYNTTLEAAIEFIQKERFGKEKNVGSLISDKFFSLTEGKNVINTTASNNN